MKKVEKPSKALAESPDPGTTLNSQARHGSKSPHVRFARILITDSAQPTSQPPQNHKRRSETPQMRKPSLYFKRQTDNDKQNFSAIEGSLHLNTSSYPVPKKENKGDKKKEEKTIVTTPEAFVFRKFKVYTGKQILKRSKNLLSNIRSPKEMYQEAFEFKRPQQDEMRQTNRFGTEKLKEFAKRLDITLNLHEYGDVRNKKHLLKEIPVQYYQKLRNLSTKHRSRTPNLGERVLKEQGGMTPTPILKKEMNQSFDVSLETPKQLFTLPMDRFEARKKSLGFDIVKREKKLFLSSLEESLETYSTPTYKHGQNRYSETCGDDDESMTFKFSVIKEMEKNEQRSWLMRTSLLRDEINSYLSTNGHDSEFIDSCQEKMGVEMKKLEAEQIVNGVKVKPADLYDKEDTDELAKMVKERKGKIYTVLRGGRSISQQETVGSRRLYKQILFKERKAVDKIINAGRRSLLCIF